MSAINSVALVGASGNIGTAVLKALLDANFNITVLARSESTATFQSAVKVVKVDYNNTAALTSAMEGQDALISTLGYAAILSQEKLVDAAIAAGIKRIIPSEYGVDPEVPAARNLPVFGHKVQIAEYIKQKVQSTGTTYTLICNNEFFDWDLDHSFGVDIKAKKMEIFDGGDVPFTATPLDFVARGVASVLQHPEETANRVVRLHGTTMTQNKLLGLLKHFTGSDGWEIEYVSTEEREKQGYEVLQQEPMNFVGWAMPLLQVSIWARKCESDFERKNDNALLELKELSEEEIEEIIKMRC